MRTSQRGTKQEQFYHSLIVLQVIQICPRSILEGYYQENNFLEKVHHTILPY